MKRLLTSALCCLFPFLALAQPRAIHPTGEKDSLQLYFSHSNAFTQQLTCTYWQRDLSGRWVSSRNAGAQLFISAIREFDNRLNGYAFSYVFERSSSTTSISSYSSTARFGHEYYHAGGNDQFSKEYVTSSMDMSTVPNYTTTTSRSLYRQGGLISPENYDQLLNIGFGEQVDVYYIASLGMKTERYSQFLSQLDALREQNNGEPVWAMRFLRTTDGQKEVVRYCYVQDGKPLNGGFARAYYEMTYQDYVLVLLEMNKYVTPIEENYWKFTVESPPHSSTANLPSK